MCLLAPTVEVADHRDPGRVGRPDREEAPGASFLGTEVGPQTLVQPGMGSLAEKVHILVGESGHELR